MRYFVVGALCLLVGCTQSAVLGDGAGGGGGGSVVADGGNGAGAAAPIGGETGQGGSPGAGPAELAPGVCEARAACETVEPDCVHDMTCTFLIFREALYPALTPCLESCGSFEDCWQAAVTGSTPPDEFALYASQCNQKVVECEGSSDGPGADWCEYDFFSAANYLGMGDCWAVGCNDVNDCMRAVVFAGEPSCIDF